MQGAENGIQLWRPTVEDRVIMKTVQSGPQFKCCDSPAQPEAGLPTAKAVPVTVL